MWVTNHIADVESDLSAIHRIDDMYALDGPRFFRLVIRLPFYKGVIRAIVQKQLNDEGGTAGTPRVASRGPAPTVNRPGQGPGQIPEGAQYTDSTQAALQANPVFRDLIEFGRG